MIYGGRRQGLVEWEGQNQPEIELNERDSEKFVAGRIQFDRQTTSETLLLGKEVIVCRVGYPCVCSDSRLGTTGFRRYASGGVYALYARDLAERTLRADRLRDQ